MLTIIAFIVTIGIIVTIHEYGHFQVARWCGVKVLRFSIGFGKPLWHKTIGSDETEFALAAIPFGGYVKMLDENELKTEREQDRAHIQQTKYSEADLARAFNRQSVYKRIAIVLAGPVANLLLAILIYWVLLLQGVVGMRPIVGDVEANSRAEKAGFVTGETIQAIDGKAITTWSEVSWILLEAALDNKVVVIKTAAQNNEIHQHKLDLTGLSQDAEVDILKKSGLTMYRPSVLPILKEVLPSGAAEAAGLMSGDQIIRIDGKFVETWSAVVEIVKANPGRALDVELKRHGNTVNVSVTPNSVEENNLNVGKIGAVVKVDEAQLEEVLI
ncbi:MAG TPA: RIP metalloprotease RseP, partial [Methylophilaceae bacterium]|nr:RIP metalloprotease RseP [Methylophilaceae bacterium]